MYLLLALSAGLVGCLYINRLYELSESVWREFCEGGVSAYPLNKLFKVFYLSFLYFDFFLQIYDFNFMVFSSLLFLFRFLPAILIVYYIVPHPWRNLVLFLFSLVFYAWGEPVYIILMLTSILISYTGGILVDRFKRAEKKKAAKAALIVSSVLSLSLLAFFKYADFVIQTISGLSGVGISMLNIALPIGISFYTFQTISYTIDVYRGEAAVQRNLISFGTYVAMFPQLIAGPIVQYKTIDAQLRSRRETAEQFAEGIHRFMIGLGKKVLLANNAGALWNTVQSMTFAELPVMTAWVGLAAYTFQIYFDFSAYSDMAIGLGHNQQYHRIA